MTKARTLADFISDGSPLADGTISVAEVSGAAPLASPTFTGTVTSTGDIVLGDNDKALFGAGSDLQIYHDGSHSYIDDAGTGDLFLRSSNDLLFTNADGSETYARFQENGYARLFYDNALKLATTSTGVDVTGTVTMDGGSTSADFTFGDNDKAIFGAANNLEIDADSVSSRIAATGLLEIVSPSTISLGGAVAGVPNMVVDPVTGTLFLDSVGATVAFIPNNGLAIESNVDLDVTGTITATTLAGDGSGITGVLKNITKTVLTTGTAATYTTPTDAFAIEVEVLGAGGGGGGVDGQGSGKAGCASAGGAGGYSQKTIMNPASSYTYTIGAGGAGAAAGNNDGSAGGTTSFTDGASVTLSSSGGEAGQGRTASGGGTINTGRLGGVASGGDLNIQGQCSSDGVTNGGARASLSTGGHTKYGTGAKSANGTANSPTGFGSGGGAPSAGAVSTNYAGTAGADGVIVITEYRE